MGRDENQEKMSQNSIPENQSQENNCSICLEKFLHPLTLPCKHQFCYLCIKGVSTTQGTRCAMCRQSFPSRLIIQPSIIEDYNEDDNEVWFYEGRNGWWQYDQRTNEHIEEAFNKGDQQTNVLIAGHMYVINFAELVQYQQNGFSKRIQLYLHCRHSNFSSERVFLFNF